MTPSCSPVVLSTVYRFELHAAFFGVTTSQVPSSLSSWYRRTFGLELRQLELGDVVVSAGIGGGMRPLPFRELVHPADETPLDRRWPFAHVADPRSLDRLRQLDGSK